MTRWLLLPLAVVIALGISAEPTQHRVYLPVVIGGVRLAATVNRGAAVPWQYQVCGDVALLRAPWWLNWNVTPGACNASGFVPMVWGRFATVPVLAPSEYLLTFNEPDNPDQAAMTPMEAAALWPQLVATGRRLASPATLWHMWATPGYLDDGWLAEFMSMVDPDTVSVIAWHYYGCDPEPLRRELAALWEQYHRPIWITEIGCPGATPAQMRALLDGLDAYHVERVAWFATRTDDWPWMLPLLDADGLTLLGREYAR